YACIGFALSNVGLALSTHPVLSHAFLLPAGACWVLALSLFNVTVQLSTPRWVVGRALSLYQTATFGCIAAGSWLWGAVADSFSPSYSLVAAGATLAVTAVAGLGLSLPKFDSLNLDPLDQFREPELRLDIKARSGPILIMIDYLIDQDDVPEFLAAM